MNDYKKDFEFRQRCGILASRICTLADKYALQMITADRFTSEASALIEKEFGALHAEVERLREYLDRVVDYDTHKDLTGVVTVIEEYKAAIKEASDGKA